MELDLDALERTIRALPVHLDAHGVKIPRASVLHLYLEECYAFFEFAGDLEEGPDGWVTDQRAIEAGKPLVVLYHLAEAVSDLEAARVPHLIETYYAVAGYGSPEDARRGAGVL